MVERPADAERLVLQARARELARPLEPPAAADRAALLVLSLGDDRFAFALEQVETVGDTRHLTRLPGAPPHVRGIVAHRGRLCAAVDLKLLSGRPSAGLRDFKQIVFVGSGDRVVGLLANSACIEERSAADFGPVESSVGWVAGVDGSLVARVDLAALLDDPRLRPKSEDSRWPRLRG